MNNKTYMTPTIQNAICMLICLRLTYIWCIVISMFIEGDYNGFFSW
jgi:hypothetical protein